MRIDGLEVGGWMPFRDSFVLELPAGPIGVVAVTDGNPRRSNWSGKTALLRAIRWCLFGAHHKRTDDAVINRHAEACRVSLRLDDMTVTRSRKRGSSTVVEVRVGDEVSRGAAAESLVVERLGMSLADFDATLCFQQEDIEAIVGMRSGERRKVISAWQRLERWAVAGQRASKLYAAAQEELVAARSAVEAGAAQVLSEDERVELQRSLDEAEQRVAATRAEIEAGEQTLAQLEEYVGDKAEKLARLAAARQEVAELRAAVKGRSRPAAEERVENAAQVRDSAVAAQHVAAQALQSLRRIRSDGFDGQCPVMCAECPSKADVETEVRRSADLLPGASKVELAARTEMTEASRLHREAERDLADLKHGIVGFNEAQAEVRELTAELASVSAADVQKAEAEVAEANDALDAAEQRLSEQLVEVGSLTQRLSSGDEAARLQVERTRRLEVAEARVRRAALAARALGPAGIPAAVARRRVVELERSANELMAEYGLSCEFSWERETQDPEPTCRECGHAYVGKRDKECPRCGAARSRKLSDDLEILVEDGSGEVEDVKLKSGGAKVLVASALRLAASSMLRSVRGSPLAFALVDEPFGPLDVENSESLARAFSGMLGAVGVEQALVVSHSSAILDALPARVVVERSGGVSSLRLES